MGIKTFFASMTMKVKIIAVCAAVAVAGGVTAAVVINSAKADTYRVLKVFELTGSAVINREGTGDLDAYVGMNLESGDTLTVNDESTMRLSLDNDKYVLLDSGTTIELVAEGTPADSRTSIELKEGTILNELTTSLSANSSYEIATPKATMAVRGTSFMVSVEENEDGSYIIKTNTFHGKVEVTLLDPDGNPTDKSEMVPEDKSVVIKTVPDSVSGNPAEVDGISFFVYETEEGVFVEVPEGSSPVTEIIYERIAEIIKEYVLRSNDNGLMTLKQFIVEKMRASAINDGIAPDTTSAEISSETSAVTSSETTAESTTPTVSESETEATTTVPVIESETETTTTAAPVTESETEATTTTAVSETESETESTTTAVSETESETEATTTTAPVTESETDSTTTTASDRGLEPANPGPIDDDPIEKYTVSFICEGSTIYSESVEKGKTVKYIPEIPEKTGYTGKWMSGVNEFTSKTVITGDMTVTAVYTVNKYTVSFILNGSVVAEKSVNYGSTLSEIPEIPEKTGYTGKWMSGVNEFTSKTVITGDMTVTAVYIVNKYTISFVADDGVIATRSADYGSTLSDIPEIPEKTGYTGKWISGGKEFSSLTVITSNMTVTAEYTINKYTVKFIADDLVISSEVVQYGDTVKTVPSVPEKERHIGKWMYNGEEFASDTVITEDTDVEAEYTALYTVRYVVEGYESYELGRQEDIPSGEVPDEITFPTILDVDDNGSYDYYLLEWEFPTDPITEDTVIPVTYDAYDDVLEVKITDCNGEVEHYLSKVGNTITLPDTASELENYEFIGWKNITSGGYSDSNVKEGSSDISDSTYVDHMISSDGTAEFVRGADVTLTDDMRLYYDGGNFKFVAVYAGVPQTVTFIVDGEESEIKTVRYGEYIELLEVPVPEKPGYEGTWTYEGAEVTDTYIEVTDDMTFEAKYTPIDYTVTFVLSEDESYEITSLTEVHYDDVLDENDVVLPTIIDYNGDGIYDSNDYYLYDWEFPTDPITEDTVIPVTYDHYDDVREVKITDCNGEVEHYLSKVDNTITLPYTARDLPGYEFVGWGNLTSGGYSDSNVKEGSSDISDYTDGDHIISIDGTAKFARGAEVDLIDDYSLPNDGNNFKFVAVYSSISGGSTNSEETESGSDEETVPSDDDSSNDDVPEEPSFNSNNAIIVGTPPDTAYPSADRTETVYCDTYENRVYSLWQNCRNIVRGLAYFISSINS